MKIDDILAGSDTAMTKELVRLFAAAGCSPTACHACGKEIKVGASFKLVTYTKKEPGATATDEMCCNNCGIKELENRYTRVPYKPDSEYQGRFLKSKPKPDYIWDETRVNDKLRPNHGGYSRPSKTT